MARSTSEELDEAAARKHREYIAFAVRTAGKVDGFDILHNGDVLLSVDEDDGYAHDVLIPAQTLAALAEASAVARVASHPHPGP
jgi:hypothetical protein